MSDALDVQIAQGYNPLTQLQNLTNLQRSQQALQQSRFELGQAKLAPAYASMMSLVPLGNNVTHDQVVAALADGQRIGGDISGLTDNLNAGMASGDPNYLGNFVRSTALRGMPAWEQLQAIGQPASVETGAGTQFGTRGGMLSPTPGAFQGTGGFVPSQVSPQWLNEPDAWTMPDGSTRTGTRGDHLRAMGVDPNSMLQGGPPVSGPASPSGGTTPSGLSKAQFLAETAQRESGGNPNILNYVAQADPTAYARGATASGKYQMVNSTWRQAAAWAGVDTNQYPTAMSAPETVQDRVASALYDHQGETPWQKDNQNWVRGQGGQYALQTVAPGTGSGSWPAPPPAGTPQPYQVASNAPVPPPSGAAQPPPAGPMPQTPRGFTLPGPFMGPQLQAGAEAYTKDQAANQNLGGRISPLTNVLSILHEHPTLTSGPGQSNWNEWMTGLQGMGIPLPQALTGADPGNVTAWQEMAKFLKQYDMGIPGGNRSDLERLGNEASQPNTEQGRNAIAILVGKAMGNELMSAAKYRQFSSQNQGAGPNGWPMAASRAQYYNLETSDWQAKQDPMAYAAAMMPPEAVGQYLKGLPNDAMRKNFVASLQDAKRLFPEYLGGGG